MTILNSKMLGIYWVMPVNQSKPGAKLNPDLKLAVDAIYKRDPVRYTAIARWVWWAQKQGWPDEAIAEACRMAEPAIHAVNQWWPYLTKLMPKAKARATETESNDYKNEVGTLASEFVEFAKWKAGKRG